MVINCCAGVRIESNREMNPIEYKKPVQNKSILIRFDFFRRIGVVSY